MINQAQIGDFVKPDFWAVGERLLEDDGFSDLSFPGCQFRLPGGWDYLWAVNIKITGRVPRRDGSYRCRIEFVGDGAPSTFTGGFITRTK